MKDSLKKKKGWKKRFHTESYGTGKKFHDENSELTDCDLLIVFHLLTQNSTLPKKTTKSGEERETNGKPRNIRLKK